MSSIPLPALAVKAPEQPDLMGQVGKMMSLKSMLGQQQIQQQTQQSNALEIQQKQQALADQKAMTKSMQDSSIDWSDPNSISKLPSIVLKNGGSSQAVFGIQQHLLEQKQKMSTIAKDDAETGGKKLETILKTGQAIGDKIDAAEGVPDTELHGHVLGAIQDMQQTGLMDPQHVQAVQQMVANTPDPKELRTQLDVFKKTSMGTMAVAKQAQAETDVAKNIAQTGEANAGAALKTAELATGGTGPMADSRYRNIIMRQKAGQPPATPEDANWAAAYEKQHTLNPVMTFKLNNTPAAGGQADSIVTAVANGQMKIQDAIPMRAPVAVRQAFLSKVLQANPQFKSYDNEVDKKIIEDLTSGGKSNTLLAYNTALKHADIFSKVADALDNGDSRALNSLGNTLGTQFGSDKATNFGIAKTLFADEFAKAATGANVGVTDREKAQELLSAASSPAQFKGAVATAKALLAGKRDAMMEQAKQGMQGKPDFGQGNSPDPAKPWEKYPVHQ